MHLHTKNKCLGIQGVGLSLRPPWLSSVAWLEYSPCLKDMIENREAEWTEDGARLGAVPDG